MLSFRSILFAAAAFATVASAIPTPETGSGHTNIVARTPADPPAGGVIGGVTGSGKKKGGLTLIPGILKRGSLDIVARTPADPPAGGVIGDRGGASCGELVKKCHDDIAVIVIKIKAAVKVEGGAKYVDHGLVISLLNEVVELLKTLLHDLKLIIKAEIILGCTLKELAGFVADLLILIIEVVWLVFSIVGFVDAALCEVIAIIGGLLCEILGVVFGLVDGLLELVVELIVPYGDHCKFVKYTQILVLLGIKL